jgi:iron complex outermembrane receptor protein
MKFIQTIIFTVFIFHFVNAQDHSPAVDSIPVLGEISVKGFETKRERLMVPASVNVLSRRDLQRYANVSLVPVLNSVPGVRMEERSPGSYRLSIRGSLLRSPFGIRNIKIYWNDFILTDAGGNTYLNLIDFNAAGRVEVLKGPAGSIYGAGTGGVVVLQSPQGLPTVDSSSFRQNFSLQLTGGSYGQFSQQFRWSGATKNVQWQFMQGHFQSDGYRENSRMRREVIQGNVLARTSSRNNIEGLLILSDLFYATPGGLNAAQMAANPRQSRPATPVLPSAKEQKAAIYNRTALLGLSNHYAISGKWTNTTSLTVAFTGFKNPFISNYEKRDENNIGLRTKFIFEDDWGNTKFRWVTGAEWQIGNYTIDSAGNNKGQPDANLVRDKIFANQQFIFTQAEFAFQSKLLLQLGLSINDFKYRFERTIGLSVTGEVPVNFKLQAAPRIGFLYKLNKDIAIHVSTSKGFSPPSVAEIRPSAGGFSTGLQAEKGWSHEMGIKGSALRSRLQFDLAFFYFDLKDAIVRRTNAAGAEFFVNAGGTKQKGIEAFVEGYLLRKPLNGFVSQIRLWSSVTLNNFKFGEYVVNTNEYSGNDLTGVPKKVVVIGSDFEFFRHWYLNGTFNYTDAIPLSDANDVFADAYRLWQARIGWKNSFKRWGLEVFAGVDNIGNEKYSLGNDLNAFGRRYFNPAPTRNYFGGVMIRF